MSQSQGAGAAASTSVLIPPHGLDQIVATFGNIFDYIRQDYMLDPLWQAEALQQTSLPFPLSAVVGQVAFGAANLVP